MTRGGGASGTATTGAAPRSETLSACASASSSPAPSPHPSASASGVASSSEMALNDGAFGGSLARSAPGASGPRGKLGRQSSKFGTVNYSVDEMRRLNEKVRLVMPLVGEDWLHVAYQFNYMRPESIPYREVESLKRKFKKMYCSRSNSSMNGGKLPDYVQEAKELRRLINQRSEKAATGAAAAALTTAPVPANQTNTSGLMEQTVSDSTHEEVDNELENELKQNGIDVENLQAATLPAATASSSSTLAEPNGANAGGVSDQVTMGPEAASFGYAPGNTATIALGSSGATTNLPVTSSDESTDLPTSSTSQPDDTPGTGRVQQKELHDVAAATSLQAASATDSATQVTLDDDPKELLAKLRQLEEEYRQSIQAKRMAQTQAPSSTSVAMDAKTTSCSSLGDVTSSTTNAGIISMLRRSIEHKKRMVDAASLSESERVRKERKKRKMEKVLLSIHQEQKDRTTSSGYQTDQTLASSLAPTQAAATTAPATQPQVPSMSMSPGQSQQCQQQQQNDDSGNMMELFIQFLVLQHQDTMRRFELEQEQRRLERLQFERALDEERARREKDKQEFMVLMAALLDNKFPPALQHYLNKNYLSDSSAPQAQTQAQSAHTTTSGAAQQDKTNSSHDTPKAPAQSSPHHHEPRDQDQEPVQRTHGMLV